MNILVLYKVCTKYIPECLFLVYTRYILLIFRVYTRYISGILHFEVCTCPIAKICLECTRCTGLSVPGPAVMCPGLVHQWWLQNAEGRRLHTACCVVTSVLSDMPAGGAREPERVIKWVREREGVGEWDGERVTVSGRGTAAPVHKHPGKVPANSHNLTLVCATRLSIRWINIKTL